MSKPFRYCPACSHFLSFEEVPYCEDSVYSFCRGCKQLYSLSFWPEDQKILAMIKETPHEKSLLLLPKGGQGVSEVWPLQALPPRKVS